MVFEQEGSLQKGFLYKKGYYKGCLRGALMVRIDFFWVGYVFVYHYKEPPRHWSL